MAAPAKPKPSAKTSRTDAAEVKPYVRDEVQMRELTWQAVLAGAVLGIVFAASSLYLVLKIGITVSASIPIAVLSITLFRAFSKVFGVRKTTILENNIVQTTGSAGESIAFGVGVTMPALMLLGFDMEITRVMTVGVLGGLLGILMMIPLRRAFIVKQHHELPYPEGTACAEVLIAGEKGGASAKTVFAGFGLAFLYNFMLKAMKMWSGEANQPLYTPSGQGLKGGVLGAEITPELLGVGYIIGPRIAGITFAGGVLAYLVLAPAIVLFGEGVNAPVYPAKSTISEKTGVDVGLIRNMTVTAVRDNYILYIGAGAVAAGGIISMFQAMPLILASILAGMRDIRGARQEGSRPQVPRTERDLPMWLVLAGSIGLVIAIAVIPKMGLGFDWHGLLGAAMIVVFGFLFVTVSSRLTGTIGSSSNPISGMTVATLLLTCLVFLLLGKTDKSSTLTALTIAAVVCIAASNGGTTAQDLKTGYLVGATPRNQQVAILIGALTSALLIGGTLIVMNKTNTIYTKRTEYLPRLSLTIEQLKALTEKETPGGEYEGVDNDSYYVLNVREGELVDVPQGRYLVDDAGNFRYLVDPAINGRVRGASTESANKRVRDDGYEVENFQAPKARLMSLIIDGILNQKLPWGLVLIGVLIAITLELARVPSLPFAVGVYLPIQISATIFIGGALRWLVDRLRRGKSGDEETSPAILLCSGYIAGGTIAGVVFAFMNLSPALLKSIAFGPQIFGSHYEESGMATLIGLAAFSVLILVLLLVGLGYVMRDRAAEVEKT